MSLKKSKDTLGDRMKGYEIITQTYLSKKQYTVLRIDGKAFHTYTKGLKRPFDDDLIDDMDTTAIELCKNMQGAICAYVQSDEISVLLTDFQTYDTQAWFDYKVQKMVSISASIATAAFNRARSKREFKKNVDALFDSRVWQLPNKIETLNYFIWRQQDATRNSISSVAQSLYSHKELEKKSSNVKQEMIFQRGINWNDYHSKYKRGRMIVKKEFEVNGGLRSKWVVDEIPVFTADKKNYLSNLIPNFSEPNLQEIIQSLSKSEQLELYSLLYKEIYCEEVEKDN